MRKLWQLILAGRLKGSRDLNFYDWFSRLAVDGWTSGLKSELRDILRPCVALAQPYGSLVLFDNEAVSDSVSAFASWEVVLSADYACAVVRENQTIPAWRAGLPGLLGEFQCLLNEALELMADLSDPAEGRKPSVLDIPSIKDHSQNRGDNDWTVLVSLTRDAWLALSERDCKLPLK